MPSEWDDALEALGLVTPDNAADPSAHENLASRFAKGLVQGAANLITTPGKLAAANPYAPGSEEADWYDQQKAASASSWAPQMALGMLGGGTSFIRAAPGEVALGAAGARRASAAPAGGAVPLAEAPPVDIWRHPDPSSLAPGQLVHAGGQGNIGTFNGVSPGGIVNVDWRSPGTPFSSAPLSDAAIERALAANPGASIFDIAGIPARAARPAPAAPSPQIGPMPATGAARRLFDQHIAPHMGEDEFAQKYFAGMSNKDLEAGAFQGSLDFSGPLIDAQGRTIGAIDRTIDPETGTAFHNYLKLNSSLQGAGMAKELLSNQIDLYNKMGLKKVALTANIDVGSYAWPKYGFVPSESEWSDLAPRIAQRARDLAPDPATAAQVQRLTNSSDPKSVWSIADITKPDKNGDPLGKSLLLNHSYHAELDLNDPESMERFNAYVRK